MRPRTRLFEDDIDFLMRRSCGGTLSCSTMSFSVITVISQLVLCTRIATRLSYTFRTMYKNSSDSTRKPCGVWSRMPDRAQGEGAGWARAFAELCLSSTPAAVGMGEERCRDDVRMLGRTRVVVSIHIGSRGSGPRRVRELSPSSGVYEK